jgi:hypothetical protein
LSAPHFSSEQRDYLARLGLIPAQVDALETALSLCALYIGQPQSRMADVRAVLDGLAKKLKRAKHDVSRVLGNSNLPALHDASLLLQIADFNRRARSPKADGDHDPRLLAELAQLLEASEELVGQARLKLPKEQARARASPRPIEIIDHALQLSWTQAHTDSGAPAYPFRVSTGEGSAFRHIVGVCYQAMGRRKADPVRAIRAFKKAERELYARLREEFDRAAAETAERQTAKNSSLPS